MNWFNIYNVCMQVDCLYVGIYNDLLARTRTRVNDIRMYYAKQHFKVGNLTKKKCLYINSSSADINNKI